MHLIEQALKLLNISILELVILKKIHQSKIIDTVSLAKYSGLNIDKIYKILDSLQLKGLLKYDYDRYRKLSTKEFNVLIDSKINELKSYKEKSKRISALISETTKFYDNAGKLNEKLNKIKETISNKNGRIQNCEILIGDNTKDIFPNTFNNIICTPKNFDKWLSLNKKELLTFGGVCVLRTYENRMLSTKGELIKPNSERGGITTFKSEILYRMDRK